MSANTRRWGTVRPADTLSDGEHACWLHVDEWDPARRRGTSLAVPAGDAGGMDGDRRHAPLAGAGVQEQTAGEMTRGARNLDYVSHVSDLDRRVETVVVRHRNARLSLKTARRIHPSTRCKATGTEGRRTVPPGSQPPHCSPTGRRFRAPPPPRSRSSRRP